MPSMVRNIWQPIGDAASLLLQRERGHCVTTTRLSQHHIIFEDYSIVSRFLVYSLSLKDACNSR